jgi:hypothetical protein
MSKFFARFQMTRVWRELLRSIGMQIAVAAAGAAILVLIFDFHRALSFAFGVMLITTGTLFSARFGLRRAATPATAMAFVVGSLAWKWLWIVAGLYLAIVRWGLEPIWVIFGIVLAQAANICAGIWLK